MKTPAFHSSAWWLLAFALSTLTARATTYYVDQNNSDPVPPYNSWSTAATNIEDAALYANGPAALVLVTNGVYQYGGYVDSGSNRVFVSQYVTVQSVNGPAATVIEGTQIPGTTNGVNAVRCVFLSSGSSLYGFTLTNGATQPSGDGGGAYAQSGCTVSNCIICGNAASLGGGSYSSGNSALVNCKITGNFAINGGWGGGAYGYSLTNCLLTGNGAAYRGGAAQNCALINCTIVTNIGQPDVLDGCQLKNCISYYNYPDDGEASGDGNSFSNCCLAALSTFNSGNNITNPPAFADLATGDFHLSPASPCINAGINRFITLSDDLDGNPRIVFGTVDLGCYESPYNGGNIHYVSLDSTNPISPYNDWAIAATNIQDAIDAAGAGDFILVSNGVYQIGGRAVYGTTTNRVTIDKAVTVQSVNGPAVTTIGGYGPVNPTRCAYMTNGAFLSGFTLTNGWAGGSGSPLLAESGGGVWCNNGSATISNCVLVGNTAPTYGGAVFQGKLINCVLTNNNGGFGGAACSNVLLSCTLINNSAIEQNLNIGGGACSCTLSNCFLIGNLCRGGAGFGGGAYSSTLTDCVVSNNSAWYGGGVALSVVTDSLISSNRANSAGGGSYSNTLNGCVVSYNSAIYGGGACYGKVTDCIFSNNIAGTGGGACSNALVNCLLINNQAHYDGTSFGACGGAAFNSALINCTVVSNTAISAPGGAAGGGVYGGTISNSIVYFNSSTEAGQNFYNSGLTYCDTTPLPAGGAANITNDPALVDPAGNYRLQSSSPCINSGNNAYVSTAVDLDGNPRIVGTVDIGAYEYQSSTSVISYAWLQQYGLPTDGSEDYTNLDGTAFNVYQDWVAGLDPTNPASVLVMLTPVVTSNSGITVSWQSVSGIFYNLQRGTNLPAFTTIQSNIPGQTGTTSYIDTTATNILPYFYRVGVVAP